MTKKSDAPAIRFKGFSDAWEQRKLGDIGETYTGLSGKTKADFGHGQARFVTYMNVFSNPISNPEMTEPIEIDPKQNEVEVGDVFFTTSSETPEEVGMSSVLLEKRGKTYLNSFCFGFRPSEIIDSYYLAYMLRSESARDKIILLAQGISRYNISKNKVMEIAVSLPSLDEQKLIGQYFRQLDNLITLHQRKFEKLTNVKKSMLEKMFPQNGSSYPEIRFKGFTDPWEQRKFEEIAVRSSVICSDDTLPRVEYEDIVSGTGRLNKDIYAKQSSKSGIVFHQGDVLYGKLRPYLQNWLLPTFDGLAVGDFWVLQPQNADSSFLYRLIQSRQFDEVANQSTGTKMPRADWKLMSKTVFSIPSNISEQAAIGTYFTALDNLITLHQRKCISFTGRAGRLISTVNKKRITSSWEQRKFGEVFMSLQNNTLSRAELNDEIGAAQNIHYGDVLIKYDEILDVSKEPLSYIEKQSIADKFKTSYLQNGDVIIADTAEDETVGKCTEIEGLTDQKVISGLHTMPVRPNRKFAFGFLGFYLNSAAYHDQLKPLMQGIKVTSISKGAMQDTVVKFPLDLKEQEQIGIYFGGLDHLITLHQRKGKAAVSGCSNDANNSKGVCCKARDFGYKCHKKDESK